MKKIIWPVISIVSIILSSYALYLGSKIIEKTQIAPPIYITYPEGYTDLPEEPKKKAKLEKR